MVLLRSDEVAMEMHRPSRATNIDATIGFVKMIYSSRPLLCRITRALLVVWLYQLIYMKICKTSFRSGSLL